MSTILIINSAQNAERIHGQLALILADEYSDVIQIERLESANDLLSSRAIDLVAVVSDRCSAQYVREVRKIAGSLPLLLFCPEVSLTLTSSLLNAGADEVLSLNHPTQEILAKLRALLRRPLRYCVDSASLEKLPN